MPVTPMLREPTSKYQAWGVEGTPWVQYHYRSAPLDQDVRKRVAQERIWQYVQEFQQRISAGVPDVPSSTSAVVKAVPDEVRDKLKVAFNKRDKQLLLQSIEACVQQGDPNQELKTRIEVLKEVLSQAIGPEAGSERAAFLFEAIKPMLPQALQEMAQETIANISSAELGKRAPSAKVTEIITDSIIPGALTLEQMDECSTSIIRARSTDEDWTKRYGVMGIHPGCFFGCHCAATWEFGGDKMAMGYMPDGWEEVIMPEHVAFNARYPRRPGFWYEANIQEQNTIDW